MSRNNKDRLLAWAAFALTVALVVLAYFFVVALSETLSK